MKMQTQHINVSPMATLWKRKDTGYWFIRHGKQKIALRTQDDRIATRKFNAWLREYHAGRVQELTGQKKTRLSAFIADFMKHQQTNAPATAYLYKIALQKAIDAWGDIYTQSITVRHIDSYIADLSRAELIRPFLFTVRGKYIRMLRHVGEIGFMDKNRMKPVQVR